MVASSCYIESPVGVLRITASGRGISSISFCEGEVTSPAGFPGPVANGFLDLCSRQLGEYLRGSRLEFDVPLDVRGTIFQVGVWRLLREIPAGETISYKQLASRLGKPGAARAVGGAANRNPVAIVVPCHRVVGSGGALVGYAAGTWRKQWLLDHERGMTARAAVSC